MGARLAKAAAVLDYPRLTTHAARVVLGYMALVALDDDKDPTYFAGNGPLALALGYRDPTSAAAQRAVERALAELEAVGIVTTSTHHPRNHKRRRLLHVGRLGPGT
jgi:hypothetical protein